MNSDEIYNILPENLKKYENLSNISRALSEELDKGVIKKIEELKIYTKIKELNDRVLDQLAWQWNVEFYSSELPKSKKIDMIKNSYFHHVTKGTAGALESALKAIVNNLEVQEWYEYGGNPYMFKLVVEGSVLTEQEIATVYKLVEIYKNVRSHLDGFVISQKDNMDMRFFSGLHDYKKVSNKFIG
ncbi:phage tail protein I [Cetobacterium somerae]|uniref:phage tail protein I n=1 Tax=Cetobacterium somerae TaxID=188913 RepID=UPI00389294FB